MTALYRKELRQLWPLALLGCLLMSGDVFTRPFTEYLDQMSWEEIASYVDPGDDGLGWILIVLSVAVAYGAFPREHDERTIDFLMALPVRARAIFAAKVAAGLTVLALPLVVLAITDGTMGSIGRESLGGGHWRASIALTSLGLQLALALIAYAHGLLASVLRLFGLVPYALVLVLGAIVEDLVPAAAWIDPGELGIARYQRGALVVPWAPLLAHLGVAALALGLAYAAWMGPGPRIGRGLERARASLAGKAALGCGTAIALTTVVVTAIVVTELGPDDDAPTPTEAGAPYVAPSIETEEASTERFLFAYPVSHRERARALIADADALHAAVAERLGADPGPRLVADLTEISGEHRGIASWTHVRVGLVTEPNESRLRHTFTHETAHAFQHRLSDRRQSTHARASRFFAEGSAEWIAYDVVPDDGGHRAHARRVAAAAWDRHGLRLADLLDDERLRARYDTTLVYSLGELFTEALVTTCGPRAIGDALRAMARPDAPRDLAPTAYWEDTLRAIGCDLERVGARFASILRELVVEERAAIDALPRLGGGVAGRDGGSIEVIAIADRPIEVSWEPLLFVRRGPEVADAGVVVVRGRVESPSLRRARFRVPSVLVGARRFQILFAVRTAPDGWPVAESWQWVGE